MRGAFCIFTTRFHRKLLGNRAATNGTQHFAGKIISLDTKQESIRLTPIWPGFVYDATYELVLSQFVVRSPLCFKRFSSGYYGFPLSFKQQVQIPIRWKIFQSVGNAGSSVSLATV